MIINTQKQLNSTTSRKRNSILNTQKLINSALAVGGLALMAAGAQAQNGLFNFTTTFTPNPVPSSDQASFITAVNGMKTGADAGALGSTNISLTNFTETSALMRPNFASITNTPFNIQFNIQTDGAPVQTGNFTGTFSGKFNNSATVTSVMFTGPASQTFNFGQNGTFVVDSLDFVAPGAPNSTTLGSIGATVRFTPGATPPAVPEPASIVPFALGGLALLGLMARKGRRSSIAAV